MSKLKVDPSVMHAIKFTTARTNDGKFVGRNSKYYNLNSTGDTASQALHRVKKLVEQRMLAEKQVELPGINAAPSKKKIKPAKKQATKHSVPAPATKPKLTVVGILADDSGSMEGFRSKLVDLVNDSLVAANAAAVSHGIKSLAVVGKFAEQFELLSTKLVEPTLAQINTSHLYCRGRSTSLRDAIIDFIASLSTSVAVAGFEDTYDVAYLLTVITDGIDNSSRNPPVNLQNMLAKCNKEGNWTIAVLTPPNSTATVVTNGIAPGNVREWEQSEAGIEEARVASSRAIDGYFATRSTGARSSSTYYVDSSNVSKKDIKDKLVDIRDKVTVLKVVDAAQIGPFCEANGKKPYRPGAAFYRLDKREKVQAYKLFILRDNKTGAIYGGADARKLLNLPATGEIPIAPGNVTDYTIFVQSTSTNRNLFAGSEVIYFNG